MKLSGNNLGFWDSFDIPDFDIPDFDLPDFDFDMPTFDMPDFDFEMPTFDFPDFSFDFDLPDWLSVENIGKALTTGMKFYDQKEQMDHAKDLIAARTQAVNPAVIPGAYPPGYAPPSVASLITGYLPYILIAGVAVYAAPKIYRSFSGTRRASRNKRKR